MDPSTVPRKDLTGRVVDASNGDPLSDVDVFLDHTSKRTTTNNDGGFVLSDVPVGVYDIAAHQNGYDSDKLTVTHRLSSETGDSPSDTAAVVLRLFPRQSTQTERDSIPLGPALATDDGSSASKAVRETLRALYERINELEARLALVDQQVNLLQDEQRGAALLSVNAEEFAIFKRFFLGKDSDTCKLLNPGVLSFEEPDRQQSIVLRVTADRPLEVLNLRLGYRLRIMFDSFSLAEAGSRKAALGTVLVGFEPLPPVNADVAEQWRKERRAAYEGSLVHLLRAMGAKQTEREGFFLSRPQTTKRGGSGPIGQQSELSGTSWVPVSNLETRAGYGEESYMRMVELEGKHRVQHTNSEPWYVSFGNDTQRFTALGTPLTPNAVQTEGYWQVRRICERIPDDYLPEPSSERTQTVGDTLEAP